MIVPETFFSISEELRLFFLSCAAGAVFGIYYDFFRTLRLTIPHHSFFVFAEDIIFLATYGIFLSSFASAEARGELRGYYVIGGIIGFTLYFFTIGRFVMRFMGKILSISKGILNTLLKPIFKLWSKIVEITKNAVKSAKNSASPLQNNDEM